MHLLHWYRKHLSLVQLKYFALNSLKYFSERLKICEIFVIQFADNSGRMFEHQEISVAIKFQRITYAKLMCAPATSNFMNNNEIRISGNSL